MPTIVLYRTNMFDQYVSLQRAEQSRQWQVYEGADVPAYTPMQLDFDDVKRFFNKNRKLRFPPKIRWKRSMIISYEQLTQHTDAAVRRALKFIGVSQIDLKPTTVKTGVPVQEAVVNYDELRQQFSPTRWKKFFQDPE